MRCWHQSSNTWDIRLELRVIFCWCFLVVNPVTTPKKLDTLYIYIYHHALTKLSGLRPVLSDLEEVVTSFLTYCRPRGKKLPTRHGLIRFFWVWHGVF